MIGWCQFLLHFLAYFISFFKRGTQKYLTLRKAQHAALCFLRRCEKWLNIEQEVMSSRVAHVEVLGVPCLADLSKSIPRCRVLRFAAWSSQRQEFVIIQITNACRCASALPHDLRKPISIQEVSG